MNNRILNASLALMVLAGVGVLTQPAFAVEERDGGVIGTVRDTVKETTDGPVRTVVSERVQLEKEERTKRIEEQKQKLQQARENRVERVLNTKQKVCQNREAEIRKVLSRINQRSTNHIAVFNKIAERTQVFYEEKGNVVDNYDELVADIATNKTASEQAVANLNTIAESFTCDVENPQAAIQGVRDALAAKRDAMKNYKTSVKNLIVAVKSVQPEADSTEAQQ